ncbi:DNA methyltransferase 1-associated protein 1 [Trichoplax sp. H2]|nr:DNA methyltransferase 1-associated protein 1 [Trichoplax sp. H2]|eukprot:RDD41481.1 DNA methyltransferase 1-associated protein 1 [Trichoplax sp. H2]
MADVREILEINDPTSNESPTVTKEAIIGSNKTKKTSKPQAIAKRPEGMNREVFALLNFEKGQQNVEDMSTTSGGYKQVKAKLGRSRARRWCWAPFSNPARTDGASLHHWRRAADVAKPYAFSKFNIQPKVFTYTPEEYEQYLHDDTGSNWTREETDHLFSLCRTFHLQFVVIYDRFDSARFPNRTMEDLIERYYDIRNRLIKARGLDEKIFIFDAAHEASRKSQLEKLYNRTSEEVKEEEMLMVELKAIEAQRKERVKGQEGLVRLMTANEKKEAKHPPSGRKSAKKKSLKKKGDHNQSSTDTAIIKFPEKSSGVWLRSSRMKLPLSIGQKKTKAVEQFLSEYDLPPAPMPTEEICQAFNDLREKILLLLNLRQLADNCEYEAQTLKHKLEAINRSREVLQLK